MSRLKIGLLIALPLLASVAYVGRSLVRARLPRALPKGQCTWYVAERCAQNGWALKFDTNVDRHALNWPKKVQESELVLEPKVGSILVLGAWQGNPYGHVGYVEEVRDKSHFVITHANYKRGEASEVLDGVQVRRAECTIDGTQVRIGDGSAVPLVGFLRRKS